MNTIEAFVGIKTILVVLSSKAMAIDIPGLRNLLVRAYPRSAVFFISTSGQPVGNMAPSEVDLVIDFTPPSARQSMLFARQMHAKSKFTVGRETGWFYRKKFYSRVYSAISDQKSGRVPTDYLASEAFYQKKVLELAGVEILNEGGVVPDRSKDIALDLN
jgi:hypothetical protein